MYVLEPIKETKGPPTPSDSISRECWPMVTLEMGLGSIFKRHHRPVLAADGAARCGYNFSFENFVYKLHL